MARRVLVIGGSRGIGRATAEAFLGAGYDVAVTYRDTPPPIDGLAVPCDVTDSRSVDAAFTAVEQGLGGVEVVVANAGAVRDRVLPRMPEADFRAVVDTNLGGALRVARRAAPGMVRAGWGRLVFVSSMVAMSGETGQANYAASKTALVGVARSLARELGRHHITANVVAPGYTVTDMTGGLSDQRRAEILARVPAGRAGRAAEVAAAVVFLAGERSGYVNGAIIPVDGGAGMGW